MCTNNEANPNRGIALIDRLIAFLANVANLISINH